MVVCDPWLYTCPNFEFCEKRVDDVVHYVCENGHTNERRRISDSLCHVKGLTEREILLRENRQACEVHKAACKYQSRW